MVNFGCCEHLCAHMPHWCLSEFNSVLERTGRGEGLKHLTHPSCLSHTEVDRPTENIMSSFTLHTHAHGSHVLPPVMFYKQPIRNARMTVDTIYTHRKLICLHLKWAANHCNRIIEAVNWSKSGQFVNEALFLWIRCSQIEMILSLKSPVYLTIQLISPKNRIIIMI